jgi:2'-5' RNA ligase
VGACQLEEAREALKLRPFFGLPVPEAQRRELEPYLAACAAKAPDFRWTPAANLHLTVRFIGSIEYSAVEAIANRLAATELHGFDIALGGVGTFKRGRLVRVVWLHVTTGVDAAPKLAAEVEQECVAAGLEPETRAFKPHLTLARARGRAGAPLPPIPPPPSLEPWHAGELVLYRSRLGRGSSVYEPVRILRLS